MNSKKGFTLVELLATMVILGIIMVVAVPNVIGIFNNSKNTTYVEDAKKLRSLAEYKFRSDSSIEKPASNKRIILTLGYLDNSEFEDAPNNKPYDKDKSFVIVSKMSDYEYDVVLVDSDGKGLWLKDNKVDTTTRDSVTQVSVEFDEINKKVTFSGNGSFIWMYERIYKGE